MAKAAKVKVRVSTQPVVLMEAEVARKIRQHARSSMKAEVCGILIGNTDHERMVVEACIQGINAAQGGAHVTFTQDTWEHIYKIKDKEYPEQKIVGWYHSHPGFGVFLSEHDLFIQQNFFSNPQQVAWVYDPHTDEEGCFGWIGERIEKLSSIRVGFSQSVEAANSGANDYEDEDGSADPVVKLKDERRSGDPAWVRWTSLALGYLTAAILGVMLGFWLWGRPLGQAAELAERYLQIEQRPVEFCQQVLERYAPSLLAPPFAPAEPPAGGIQKPGGQNPPAHRGQKAPASGTQAQPSGGGQTAPAPGAAKDQENPKPASPRQEKSPAQKGNDGKH